MDPELQIGARATFKVVMIAVSVWRFSLNFLMHRSYSMQITRLAMTMAFVTTKQREHTSPNSGRRSRGFAINRARLGLWTSHLYVLLSVGYLLILTSRIYLWCHQTNYGTREFYTDPAQIHVISCNLAQTTFYGTLCRQAVATLLTIFIEMSATMHCNSSVTSTRRL